MRKISIAAVAIGLAALGTTIPIGSALAASTGEAGVQSAHCDSVYRTNVGDGKVRAFDKRDCYGLLGATAGSDSNWGNYWGPFWGGDNDAATSVMNTGTYSNGVNVVKFYRHADYRGGHGCLTRGEKYADYLGDNKLSDGYTANNSISSHKWVRRSACSKFLT